MRKILIAFIILLFGFIILTLFTYNKLIDCETSVEKDWKKIESIYIEKNNYLPSLVNILKSYDSDKNDIYIYIARIRNKYLKANSPDEYDNLDRQLNLIIDLAIESYPQILNDSSFIEIQNKFTFINKNINTSIFNYNKSVSIYNEALNNITLKWIASILHLEEVNFFNSEHEILGPIVHINFKKQSLISIKKWNVLTSKGW